MVVSSIKLDYILNPSGAAEKKIAVCVHWKAPSDQRLHRVGPALGKSAEVANGVFEGLASGINRAEDDLILQNQIAHHEVGIDFDGSLPSRNASEDKNPVSAEILHHFERQARSTGRFVNEINVADMLGKHFGSDFFRRNIVCADGFQ